MMATSELPASSSNADALLVSDSNSIRFERPFIGLCIQILMATFWLGLICSFILSPLVILGCELGDDWHPILDMPKNSVVILNSLAVLSLMLPCITWPCARMTFLWLKSLCSALFSPRIVLTLDSAGVTIGCSGLLIGWEEIDGIKRVHHAGKLGELIIKPLDWRCGDRWKECWRPSWCGILTLDTNESTYESPMRLRSAITVLNSGVYVLDNDAFDLKQLDESLRELYGVFHGSELRVIDTGVLAPISSTLPAAAADPPAIAIPASEFPASSSNADALLVAESNSIRFERPSIGVICIQILMATFMLGVICSLVVLPPALLAWGLLNSSFVQHNPDPFQLIIAIGPYLLAIPLAYCTWPCAQPTFLWLKSLCSALFSPRIVLTLDSAGVTIGCSGLLIGWEEIDGIKRVHHAGKLGELIIKPLDWRCGDRWKECWRPSWCGILTLDTNESTYESPMRLRSAITVLNSGVYVLDNDAFDLKQLDESLRELYGVFHGGELRVIDTGVLAPTSSTLPAAAADPPAIAIPAIALKSFAKSRYKALYSSTSLRDINSGTVLQDMQSMIFLFAAQRSIPRDEAQAFVDRVLQHIRGDSDGLIVDEIAEQQDTIRSAVRLWACAEQLTVGEAQAQAYQGPEVCSILNEAIREDAEPILEPAIRLARAITFFCCSPKYDSKQWPDGENSTTPDTTYRGGGLPRRHIPWFSEPGKTFRSRQFISSSFQWSVAKLFMDRRQAAVQAVQHLEREDPILWVFKFQRDCLHVNFIDPSASGFEGELEFLLVPYTVLTVEEAKWQETPTIASPHVIILRVASDNRAWPEDLPTAPWA